MSLPKHAMENDDFPVCDLYKEPDNSIESLQPTASEPTDTNMLILRMELLRKIKSLLQVKYYLRSCSFAQSTDPSG